MARRVVFHSVPNRDGGWAVKRSGRTVSRHRTQKAAETAAIKAGRKALKQGGLGQAILHKSNGTIRQERTYGADPKRAAG